MKAPTMLKKVQAWETAKQNLAEAQAYELQLRLEICKAVSSPGGEGTTSVSIPGYTVTVVNKLNRTLDVVALDGAIRKDPELIGTVIDYKPSLSLDGYRKLSDARRRSFDHCLIVKPATPTLAIKHKPTE